ncbi:oligosaccharide flippase family protein [Kordiimonas sp.]|uniref:oligosaccharide flippase family protein n=1 Tax=Kordiimonas sp. TaxID=1970157 RepID=UPI003A94A677
MLRTAFLILSGNATTSLLLLARNLIVARLIPVEDYGIAATFAVVMAMVEMASAFGLQQQIVQSKDGDAPRFQASLQGFQLLRGLVAGIVLFLIAKPTANFLGVPEVIWAYQLLALVPFIKAFEHFDIHRFNRQMRFWPLVLTGGVPALISLLMVWPLAAWFGDWRVALYALLAQTGLATLTSHLMAERPYRPALDCIIIRRSLRFGWPILVNALLLFLVFQGDKLIVGRVLGMEALAIFAMGMTLTLTPTLIIAKSAQNFFLPQLSAARDTQRYWVIANRTLQSVTGAALVFLFAIVVFGGSILHGFLGEKYASLIPLLIWFAIGQVVRVVKAGPAIVALSLGNTSNAMLSNFPRVVTLPLVWVIAEHTGTLLHILLAVVVGETISALVAFYLMARRSKQRMIVVFAPQIPGALAVLAVGLWVAEHPPTAALPSVGVIVMASIALVMMVILMPAIREMVWPVGKR